MDVVGKVVQFTAETRFEAIPPAAIDMAKTAVLDALGTAVLGSREDCGRITAQIARAEGAVGEASVYGQGFQTSAANAALANGTASHSMDYDHSFGLMGQPTSPVIPAVVSLGEAIGASGRQVLEAYVTGAEVSAKLAIASRDAGERNPALRGWHANGTVGSLGAGAACARLLSLDAERAAMAIGAVSSMASALSANFGTMTKPLHVGLAARNGVLAARLAHAGFTANPQAFMHFVSTPAGTFETLGEVYELVRTGIRVKPYPCGGVTHESLDALLAIRKQHSLTPEMIESIEMDVTQSGYGLPFNGVAPETGLQGKFCLPYIVARAAVDGEVSPYAFTDEAVKEGPVQAMMQRIQMRLDPHFEATADKRPARATVHLKSGETYTHQVEQPKGGIGTPMTAEEMRAKFFGCARGILDQDAAQQAVETIERLDILDDIRPLCKLLSGNA